MDELVLNGKVMLSLMIIDNSGVFVGGLVVVDQ